MNYNLDGVDPYTAHAYAHLMSLADRALSRSEAIDIIHRAEALLRTSRNTND